ncbi:type I polyketide synthase [Alkalihalobacterium bogoriense]|uniref:type I polyketide synthase n=1 Tax=Alkalihalobacterium bogoriense TaxID=246272 RepID=UPI00054FF991|nr:type I polyketide synthase [Alkalihalobacterium bogoriense]
MYTNLVEVVNNRKDDTVRGITYIHHSTEEVFVSYAQLYDDAIKVLDYLHKQGLKQGDELIFQIDEKDPQLFITLFWACIVGKIIAVPVTPGNTKTNQEKLEKIWDTLQRPYIAISEERFEKLQLQQKIAVDYVVFTEALFEGKQKKSNVEITLQDTSTNPDDIAFIQFSSGSTGDPKGVILTHENLLTNIYDIIEGAQITEQDSILSWMPLTHDMGLIGNHLTPMTLGIQNYIMPTTLFIRQPLLWLSSVSKHQVTMISSPNFGYSYYLKRFYKKRPQNLDLSSVRLIVNGAEPISKEICDEFLTELQPFGLRQQTMFTVYGLAEASLAVTFPSVGEPLSAVHVDRNQLIINEQVHYIDPAHDNSATFVELGKPLRHVSVRIVDDAKKEVAENTVGHIEIKGKNVTKGYYQNEEATKACISEDCWLHTGDLGFVREGKLVVTGRAKDIIFVNGQNFYAHDLERLAEQVEPIEIGKVCAVGVFSETLGRDEVIFCVVEKKNDMNTFIDLSNKLKEHIVSKTGVMIDYVIPVKQIPKTSSGKLQRFKLAKAYSSGEYEESISVIEQEQQQLYKKQSVPEMSKETIMTILQQKLAGILGFVVTDTNRSLLEMGVDSIKVPELQRELEEAFAIDLPVTLVFDYPTLSKMTNYINNRLNLENYAGIQQSEHVQRKQENLTEKIAIVGIGCRFPGGMNTPKQFFEKLLQGYDAIEEIPLERWNINDYYDELGQTEGTINTKYGGFLKHVDLFDPQFFGITPIEAKQIDPQHRLLLEVSFEALQDAGLPLEKLEGSQTGVFVGISNSDYLDQVHSVGQEVEHIEGYTLTGNMHSAAAGRISHTFGFEGPAVAVDTACSSSLVSVHQAMNALKLNECDSALAGGVNLIFSPKGHVGLTRLQALAPDGRCKTFDDAANGYVRSEGCGIVVLKRYEDAVRDGDRIYATIVGSAINHDGKSSGLTVPNGVAQQRLVQDALRQAKLFEDDIDYIELHGTGTKLGDPQEVNALSAVFANRSKEKPIQIGSVKSNIGHLESAAGIAGLIKSALVVHTKEIPGNLHFQTPNRFIQWDTIPFAVASENVHMEEGNKPKRAGVSSFGLSGTNAHIIVEEASRYPATFEKNNEEPKIMTLSAQKQDTLTQMVAQYCSFLETTDERLEDICYSTTERRDHLAHRVAIAASTKQQMLASLQEWQNKMSEHQTQKDIFVLFSSERKAETECYSRLYERYDSFRESVAECQQLIEKLVRECSGTKGEYYDNKLAEQLALFKSEYAFANLLRSLHITPHYVSGNGIGILVAGYMAETLTLHDALVLLFALNQTQQVTVEVKASSTTVDSLIKTIGINEKEIERKHEMGNTEQVTGQVATLVPLVVTLRKKNISYVVLQEQLKTEGINLSLESLVEKLIKLELKQPIIPIYNFKRGRVISEPEWSQVNDWLTQSALQERTPYNKEMEKESFMLTLPLMEANSWEQMICSLYEHGVQINWHSFNQYYTGHLVSLPLYPLNKKRYWLKRKVNNRQTIASEIEQAYEGTLKESGKMEAYIKEIKEMIHEVSDLDVAEIDHTANLFSFGLDSLMLVQIKKLVDKKYDIDLPINRLMDDMDTVEKISNYIASEATIAAANVEEMKARAEREVATAYEVVETPNEQQFRTEAPVHFNSEKSIEQMIETQTQLSPVATSLESVFESQLKWMETSMNKLANQQLETIKMIQTPVKTNPYTPLVETKQENVTQAAMPLAQEEQKPLKKEVPKINFRAMKLDRDIFTNEQKAFIEQFISKYNMKTKGSKQYAQANRRVLSDWIASLNFRMSYKDLIYPIVSERSQGARFWDVDGNEYLDMAIGYGVHYFGHRPQFVIDAIQDQLAEGYETGPQTDLAGEVATLVTQLTGAERVAFCNTGSEAVMAAMRISRTVTKRKKVVIFRGSYHGNFDSVLAEMDQNQSFPISPGTMPGMVEDVIVLDYGTEEAIQVIKERHAEIAAVMVEPVQSRNPGLQPKEFLHEIRHLTTQIGALLIFDEMITGFRCHVGGAQAHFGIVADLATYGKIVGGGLPIGILAGKAEFVDTVDGGYWEYGDDSYPEKEMTFFAGTFCKHPLSLAASRAVLQYMKDNGPAVQDRVTELTRYFVQAVNDFFEQEAVPLRVRHFASQFKFETYGKFNITMMPAEMDLFFYMLMEKGIYTWEKRICFFSTEHTIEDADYFLRCIHDAVVELRAGGFEFRDKQQIPAKKKRNNGYFNITNKAETTNYFPVSDAQKRTYIINQMGENERATHLPMAMIVTGNLDLEKVEQCFQAIIQRHDVFRTSFTVKDGEIVQSIASHVDFSIDYKDGTTMSVERLITQFMEPFDLAKAPLIKLGIAKLEEESHLFFMDFHHIIADGYSANIVAQEFMSLYKGERLPEVKIQYRDYVNWHQVYLTSKAYEKQQQFWLEQWKDGVTELVLPTDFPRPPIKEITGKTIRDQLSSEQLQQLKKLARENGTSLYMVLVSLFNVLLTKLTGQTKIAVGTPVVVRGQEQFETMVGMCTNTIVLQNEVHEEDSFSNVVTRVKKTCSQAFANLDYLYEDLIENVKYQTPLNRNPLFDVMFIYENGNDRVVKLDELQFTPYHVELDVSLFDLTFEVIEENDMLSINLYYSNQLFKEETMKTWLEYYQDMIEQVMADDAVAVGAILKEKQAEIQRFREKANTLSLEVGENLKEQASEETSSRENNPKIKEIEQKLASTLAKELGVSSVHVHANFFELGMRSLTALKIVEKLKTEFEMNIMDVFHYPSVAKLARHLAGESEGEQKNELSKRRIERVKDANATVKTRDIAIIGMEGKFPGANTLEQFWNVLKEARETISFFSEEELLEAGLTKEIISKPHYVKAKGVLEDIEYFDSHFFDYSPHDAKRMDPQIRLFHEYAWKALESAGYATEQYEGLIGVFGGSASNYEWISHIFKTTNSISEKLERVSLNDKDYMSTRISYKLNLLGPSYTVQTACSTSLTALNLACQSILNGECDIALAGGVSIMLPNKTGYEYQEGLMLSKDGKCRPFDEKASGTVFGDGIGIVVLKHLDEAIADGDYIHAVIKGSAVNNDGIRKVGYTAPSIEGQKEVIQQAYELADIDPETVTYVEAHGTGTEIGDPIEIQALTQAFQTKKRHYCAIGSVKSNIGHVDAAAGVAGLIKTVLALQHKQIPASLHFTKPNPNIDFEHSPFYVNTKLVEWKRLPHPKRNGESLPLRAGVSSFGFGGTNAHVIVEEAPVQIQTKQKRAFEKETEQLIVLSSKSKSSLLKMCENIKSYLQDAEEVRLSDIAYSLQTGRKHFRQRVSVVGSTPEEICEKLTTIIDGKLTNAVGYQKESVSQIVFMFPGQGAQYVNMGLQLYENEPYFKEQMKKCFAIVDKLATFSLKDILFPYEETAEAKHRLKQTYVTQVALFVIEYALAKLLMKWGIRPTAMIGHSLGEYVAATIAGVFSLQEALALVVERAKLMQEMEQGVMVSVPLAEEEVLPLLESIEGISIAAVNGAKHCVVSGYEQAIVLFENKLEQLDMTAIRLQTSHAFHSAMMDTMLPAFEEKVKQVTFHPPEIPYVSNLTGTWITVEDIFDPSYWSKHLRHTVKFYQGASELLKQKEAVFIEVGPGKTLQSFMMRHPQKTEEHVISNVIRHPKERVTDNSFLYEKIGMLWRAGVELDWHAFNENKNVSKIPLPTYPFKGQYYPLTNIGLNQTQSIDDISQEITTKQNYEKWFYRPYWSMRNKRPVRQQERETANWLIFADAEGIGEQLATRLQQEGDSVAVLQRTEHEYNEENGHYFINPANLEHYQQAMEQILKRNGVPHKILHLWAIDDHHSYEHGLDAYFYSFIYTMQALEQLSADNQVDLFVISNEMHTITGFEHSHHLKGVVRGPAKVIPQEFPHVRCRSIDLSVQSSPDQSVVVAALYDEVVSEEQDEVVAYRGNYRFIENYERFTMPKREASATDVIKEEGVYFITGGLGGIGLTIAKQLAKKYRAKLILTGRSSFLEQEKWESWLQANQGDRTSEKIKAIQEIQNNGGQVLIVKADVTSSLEMKAALEAAEETFGPINGIIHTAGVPGQGMIRTKTVTEANRVLQPKVEGTLVLDELCKEKELDFFFICSSLASITGELGQVDYVAANAFIDHYVETEKAHSSRHVFSVNWDNWEDIGMAADASKTMSANLAEMLTEGLKPEEGARAFVDIVEAKEPRVIVSVKDLDEQQQAVKDFGRLENLPSNTTTYARPELSTEYVEPKTDVEKLLADIWQSTFSMDKIGINDDFTELGGDSLYALSLATAMKKHFKVDITDIYNYPTISKLAQALSGEREELKDTFEKTKLQFKKYMDSHNIEADIKADLALYRERNQRYTSYDLTKTKQYEHLLLTGSTGYLGIYLLHELLTKTNATIYTMIRAKDKAHAKQRLYEQFTTYFSEEQYQAYEDRIVIIAGQVTEPHFGLDSLEYERLCETVDCIVNATGKVDHYGDYQQFETINITAVTRLLEFAGAGKPKDIHHMSTKGLAAGYVEGKENVLFTEYDVHVGQKIDNYYVETKLEAEQLLLAARERGVTTNIYRIGDIVFDSRTGVFQENITKNAVYLMIRGLWKLKLVPQLELKFIDFTFVDQVSQFIVALLTKEALANEVFHLHNPKKISFTPFLSVAEKLGTKMETMSFDDFLDYLYEHYDDEDKATFIQDFLVHSHFLEAADNSHFVLESEKTTKILEALQLSWNEPNEEHLVKMIEYGMQKEFF